MSFDPTADLTAYLPLIVIALALLAVLVWIISRTNRRARVTDEDGAPGIFRDVLEEGAAPAQRNQALIDAPRGVGINEGDQPAMANAPAPAPAPAPQPAPAPAPAPAPVASGQTDDLTRIKGLGPKIAALLGEFGITTFAQVAAWTPDDVENIDAKLGRFSGRIVRDQWVEQAKLLAAGDESGFTARFGNNG
jgi:predicted flap endonuclease-1-like 5' DNA nuclease